ncbi:hypothetical protein K7432_018228, partial [Basidiobolus ranarum]
MLQQSCGLSLSRSGPYNSHSTIGINKSKEREKKIYVVKRSSISTTENLSEDTQQGSLAADDKVVVGYYVPWGKVEPEQLSLDKVTHINYGFGVLTKKTADPTEITIDRYYDGNRIRKLKQVASAKGVKTLISLGGWTGSQTFSTVVRDAAL